MDLKQNNESATIAYKPPRIKVCGMTDIKQLEQLPDLGVQFAGLIFYPGSPRFVKNKLSGEQVKKAKLKVFKIGVFVNPTFEQVVKEVDDYGLDMVQLHGDETPFLCRQIANYISVIKAFRFRGNVHFEWMVKDYYPSSDMFLFDAGGEGYGGTGKKFNWRHLKGNDLDKSFFLGGGIGPDDAEEIKSFMKDKVAKDLFSVDINSCFESTPGVKNLEKVKSFVEELNIAG